MKIKISKWIKENRIALIISLIIFGASFGIERLTLNMDKLTNIRSILMYLFAKVFCCIFLILICLYLKKIIKEIRMGQYVRLVIFAAVFVFYGIALYCTWPGVWIPDATNIMHYIINFETNVFGQGFLTVFVYYTGLMLLPTITSVLLVQICLVAMIISKMCTELVYERKYLIAIAVCLMETLPPVVFYNLLPMRASLFSHLMLLLVYEVWRDSKEKVTINKILFVSLLVALLAAWRFDALELLLVIPIGCVFLWHNNYRSVKKDILLFIMPLAFFVIFKAMLLVNLEKGMELSGRIVMINPLSLMLQEELKGNNIEKDLDVLDEFLDLEVIKSNPSAWDTNALYVEGGCLRYDTNKTIGEGLMAYADIILNNPGTFIKARWQTTLLVETSTFVCLPQSQYTAEILQAGSEEQKMEEVELYNVKNSELRDNTLLKLYKIQPLWRIMGSVVILAVGFAVGCVRDKGLAVISLVAGIYSMIIFATVPNVWFMYYLPTYMLGGFIVSIVIDEITRCFAGRKMYIKRHRHMISGRENGEDVEEEKSDD